MTPSDAVFTAYEKFNCTTNGSTSYESQRTLPIGNTNGTGEI